MTTETPPEDWVLFKAARLCGWDTQIEGLRRLYSGDKPFRALCDMIAKHEKPPVDRKVLCAREAAALGYLSTTKRDRIRNGEADADFNLATSIRAIELYEEGFGK
jgi:hypothetical protein